MKKSNIGWAIILISVVFEVIWVTGLKHADSLWEWAGTVIAIMISFVGLIMAGNKLPVGTVYAVFTGLGAAAIVCSEIIFFDEPIKLSKLLLIGLLLVGVVGLKMVTDEKEPKGEKA